MLATALQLHSSAIPASLCINASPAALADALVREGSDGPVANAEAEARGLRQVTIGRQDEAKFILLRITVMSCLAPCQTRYEIPYVVLGVYGTFVVSVCPLARLQHLFDCSFDLFDMQAGGHKSLSISKDSAPQACGTLFGSLTDHSFVSRRAACGNASR